VVTPLRFHGVDDARAALDAFFADVSTAVLEGNMDREERPEDYRIVKVPD